MEKKAVARVLPHPLSGKITYDIPGGSKVQLKLHCGEVHEGEIYRNPKYEGSKSIKLLNSTRIGSCGPMAGVQSFARHEIYQVIILEEGAVPRKPKVEYQLSTFVVSTPEQFQNLLHSLKFGVTEVGLKMFGLNYGRFAKIYWVLLTARETIIAINTRALREQGYPVWEELKEMLFENPCIAKIVHNIRTEADFLFHSPLTNAIELKNVFDTQVCSYYFMKKNELLYEKAERANGGAPGSSTARKPSPVEVEPLSTVLRKYMDSVFHGRECEIMKTYESVRICKDSPYAILPMPEPKTLKYMALTVKYLVPLKQVFVKEFMKGYKECVGWVSRTMISMDIGDSINTLFYEENTMNGLEDLVKGKVEEDVEAEETVWEFARNSTNKYEKKD